MLMVLDPINRVVTAPSGTLCGNYKCQRIVKPEDTEIVRYMGRIYHNTCFNGQVMSREQARNRKEQTA